MIEIRHQSVTVCGCVCEDQKEQSGRFLAGIL